MEKRLKPNSRERDSSTSWSELSQDLLISVFERLGFADFRRAKTVCLSWHSASKQSVPKVNETPWLILFPEEDNNNKYHSCTLLNPEEKGGLYKTQDMGLEFAKSVCRATYGNWLLMQDPCYNPYIVNLFTKERINLPPVESQLGMVKVERTKHGMFRTTFPSGYEQEGHISMGSPVFWIDEKTKDYIVIWVLLGSLCVVYSKKVDSLWKQIPIHSNSLRDMVYKDHKLYCVSYYGWFDIFDFSGDIPQKIFHGEPQHCQLGDSWSIFAAKLVVTVTGEVVKVERLQTRMTLTLPEIERRSKPWSFGVIKVYSPGSLKKHQLLNSLGDESLLVDQGITELANDESLLVDQGITELANDESLILDQGITKLANDIDGFIRNYIYFSGIYDKNTVDVFLFNLKTRKTESLLQFDCSSVQFSGVRWFLPSFTHTT